MLSNLVALRLSALNKSISFASHCGPRRFTKLQRYIILSPSFVLKVSSFDHFVSFFDRKSAASLSSNISTYIHSRLIPLRFLSMFLSSTSSESDSCDSHNSSEAYSSSLILFNEIYFYSFNWFFVLINIYIKFSHLQPFLKAFLNSLLTLICPELKFISQTGS
ncbi:hypothetical protein BpHYR1_003022 [Brachionus plicatilis]|uniref:Uncharacterized protein n=1 Tax=Brachionus plicatilis TaxID=10195 RepID=A0A3M7PAQ9_BRAPC|nr:hypothetical protein BpHYR1_003022 [Brachionus plicatilis]